jgi:hypothetical protein
VEGLEEKLEDDSAREEKARAWFERIRKDRFATDVFD